MLIFAQISLEAALGGRDEDRNLAINKWLQIASSTLHTRANHFLRFILWTTKQGVVALPLTEPVVHHYFVTTAAAAAPTAFRSFLSSVGFAKFVVGLGSADAVLMSGRIVGLSAKAYMDKRPLCQREPLLVAEVERLEKQVLDEERGKPDRVAAGYFLFLTFGRARYSDGQRVTRLKLSACGKYLEAEVARSKSSMSLERKTRLLPVTANAEGILGSGWGRVWFGLLASEGITSWEQQASAPGSAEPWSLDTVLGKIRQRSFRPDAPRGEQFQDADAAAAPAAAPEDECGVGDMVSSSEDSADEEHPDRELDEAAEAEALGRWHGRVDLAKLGESPQFYRHTLSRVLHLLAEEGGTTFKCGRTITAAYENLVDMPRVLYPRCKQCFRSMLQA
ncbi:SLC24A2 [Symbiodinium sp. CCMP2592]|nr:SLC24A2 [Symbiodinium sp. CCMP2592]